MFDMGFTEILLIAIIAFIFLGPDKLPKAMAKVARFFKDVREMVNSAKATLEDEMKLKELKDEALHYRHSLEDAKRDITGFKNSIPNPVQDINRTVEEARRDFSSFNPKESMSANVNIDIDREIEEKKNGVKDINEIED